MPLNAKGKRIQKAMVKFYGEKKGKEVFYAMIKEKKLADVEVKPKKKSK